MKSINKWNFVCKFTIFIWNHCYCRRFCEQIHIENTKKWWNILGESFLQYDHKDFYELGLFVCFFSFSSWARQIYKNLQFLFWQNWGIFRTDGPNRDWGWFSFSVIQAGEKQLCREGPGAALGSPPGDARQRPRLQQSRAVPWCGWTEAWPVGWGRR